MLSAGPLAVGTVIRGWVRIPGESARLGIYLVADEVITEYDPPRAYATRITDQPVLTRLTFDPVANGTHVTAICDDTLGFEQALTAGVFLRGQLERRILKSRQEGWEWARALLEEPAA